MRYAWIKDNDPEFAVQRMCRLLCVSRSGFYAWRDRAPSAREQGNIELAEAVKSIFANSRETYGSIRVSQSLRDAGRSIGRHRVRRVMREAGLRAAARRAFRVTTNSNHSLPVAENLLQQHFVATAPHKVWLSDITYIKTDEGWLFLACVLDLYSRRIVGWATSTRIDSELIVWALSMAAWRFKPEGTICHSDRGVQYASQAYQAVLKQHGLVCSMSRRGNCYDNAPMESFFRTLKVECLYRRRLRTRDQAKRAIADYIESFYNSQRMHTRIGFQTPQQAMRRAS
ncbi:MAG: IS3 family transposase [Xanthomonadales bacterium]|nr:IS3 family transposase [Xanthomonadales bacterium]